MNTEMYYELYSFYLHMLLNAKTPEREALSYVRIMRATVAEHGVDRERLIVVDSDTSPSGPNDGRPITPPPYPKPRLVWNRGAEPPTE
jgi:hypothetical protein